MQSIHRTAASGALALLLAIGCSSGNGGHPSVKDAVENQLKAAQLGDIKVEENREKGVLTLTGSVPDQPTKDRADAIARQAATGYIVADEIGVRPPQAQGEARTIANDLDKAIEDDYKAALVGNQLGKQHIHYTVKNGVITLTGDVNTLAERAKAERLAAAVHNVQQVVNELTVKGARNAGGA